MSISNRLEDFSTIGDFFNAHIKYIMNDVIVELFDSLSFGFIGFIQVLMLLCLTLYGIRWTLGDAKAQPREMIFTMVWGLLSIGVIDPSFYYEYVASVFWELSDAFTIMMLSGDSNYQGKTLFEAINNSFSKVFLIADRIWVSGDFQNILPLLASVLVSVIFGVFYALILSTVIFVNVVGGIALLLGVIIIPISAFEMWRGVFKSWVQALLKYSAVNVYIATVVLVSNKFITIFAYELTSDIFSDDSAMSSIGNLPLSFGGLLLVGWFGSFLIKKSIELTSELTGGVMSDSKGAFSNGAAATGVALKGIGKGGKNAMSKLKGMGSSSIG
jgi:hypothetical protein